MRNLNSTNFKVYKHAPKSKAAGFNIYSIRDKKKVIDHLSYFELRNCEFHVNESGRKRVLKEGVKNVHAYIKAESIHIDILPPFKEKLRVIYNPFKNNQFMVIGKNGMKPIKEADSVFCLSDGVYVIL